MATIKGEAANKSNPKAVQEKAAFLVKALERSIFWYTISTESVIVNCFDKVFKVLQADDVDYSVITPLETPSSTN